MAHLNPIDAEYEKLMAALEKLTTSDLGGALTEEEVKLAKILLHAARAFQRLSVAIADQNSNSATKEEPAKTAAAIKEHLAAAGALLKRDPTKSTGVLIWKTFHGLTMTVETVAYLNVVNHCMKNLIATKSAKKATFKAVGPVIQGFMTQCQQALQSVQKDTIALRDVASRNRIQTCLLPEIFDGSAVEFIRSDVSIL